MDVIGCKPFERVELKLVSPRLALKLTLEELNRAGHAKVAYYRGEPEASNGSVPFVEQHGRTRGTGRCRNSE